MGVIIEICVKYPGGRTRMRVTDMRHAIAIYISEVNSSWAPRVRGI
jgi:hypothetical protein